MKGNLVPVSAFAFFARGLREREAFNEGGEVSKATPETPAMEETDVPEAATATPTTELLEIVDIPDETDSLEPVGGRMLLDGVTGVQQSLSLKPFERLRFVWTKRLR